MKLGRDELLKLHANLVRARKLDELMVAALAQGKVVSFFHSAQGEEAVAVGACTFLRRDDFVYVTHRGHGLAQIIAKGGSAKAFLAEHYGKATGSCGGTSAVHSIEPDLGIMGYSMTLGAGFALSVGWGLAAAKNRRQQVVVSFFGDGTSNRGTLHEAMNLASLWKLPIIWVCSNNLYGQFMPIKDAYPRKNIADLAAGYSMPGVVVDGQDVLAVHEAVQAAVSRARAGEGPSLVECKTYRYRAHGEGMMDMAHHQPRCQEEIATWRKRDPVTLFQNKLLGDGVVTEAELEQIERGIVAEMEEADRFAVESPLPDIHNLQQILYAD
jgi:acetoin:2,6-dichlorophenolindophenol oxidoreductase subunit alpha